MRHLFWGTLFLLSACEGSLQNIDPINPENPEAVAAQGEALFFAHCEGCHNEGGAGSLIAFQVQSPLVDYATFVIRNGRNDDFFAVEMPSYSEDDLSDDELNSILFFLRQAPKPTDGAGLYARFCANCHGDDALGGVVDKPIRDEAGDSLEKAREGEGNDPRDRSEFMPQFSPSDLSDEEISQIVSFLLSL